MTNTFGEFIKNARNNKEMSMKALTEKSGVSSAQISRLENGSRKSPRVETVKALAEALEVDTKEAMIAAGYVQEDSKENKEKTLTNEQEFVKAIDLEKMNDEELLKEFPIKIDGKTLSPEEHRAMVAYVRQLRSM